MEKFGGSLNNFSKSEKQSILEMKISEIKKLLETKKITSEELVNIHIEQVETYNPLINAVCTFTPDLAIEQAKKRAIQDVVFKGISDGKDECILLFFRIIKLF